MSALQVLPAAEAVLELDRAGLRERLLAGHTVDPSALAGWVYRGVSLGLPGWVDRLAWKTFAKVFHDDGAVVRGWNVRLRQDDLSRFEPMRDRRGAPKSFGHFHVTALPPTGALPLPVERGVLLDYGLGKNPRLDPTRCLRDPLVALESGTTDVLLGCSLVVAGPARLTTPSYFLLERQMPLRELMEPM